MILSILGKLPKLVKAITGGDKSLLGRAIDAAKVITGMDNETDAVEALKSDPEKMYQYQMALLADKHIPDRLALENVKDARSMYKVHGKKADEIAERIMKWNLPAVIGLVLINVVSIIILDDKTLVAVISGSTSSAATALLAERLGIVNFFFGSSMGSKNKDK